MWINGAELVINTNMIWHLLVAARFFEIIFSGSSQVLKAFSYAQGWWRLLSAPPSLLAAQHCHLVHTPYSQ